MGHFNKACALTGLPIAENDTVYAIPVSHHKTHNGFGDWVPWGGIIEAKYDGYGRIIEVVDSDFTKLLEKVFGINFENHDIGSAIFPYDHEKYLVEGFDINTQISRNDYTALENLGFTINDDVLSFGEVSATVKPYSEDHPEVLMMNFSCKGLNYQAQVFDLSSVLRAFYFVISRVAVSNSVKFGKDFCKYPGISVNTSLFLDFISNSEFTFVHKSAFDEIFAHVQEDPEKYEFDFTPGILDNSSIISCKSYNSNC